jgi:hypothetical protein
VELKINISVGDFGQMRYWGGLWWLGRFMLGVILWVVFWGNVNRGYLAWGW